MTPEQWAEEQGELGRFTSDGTHDYERLLDTAEVELGTSLPESMSDPLILRIKKAYRRAWKEAL